jgi:hypothetical protein
MILLFCYAIIIIFSDRFCLSIAKVLMKSNEHFEDDVWKALVSNCCEKRCLIILLNKLNIVVEEIMKTTSVCCEGYI